MPLATTTCNAVFTVSLGMAKCHISTLTNAVCMQNSVVDMVPAALAYLHLLLYEITYQTPSMRGMSLVLCISFQYSSIIFLFMWITHVLPILYCVIFLPYIIYILPIFPCVILVWEHVAYPPILPCVILWNTSKQIHRLLPHCMVVIWWTCTERLWPPSTETRTHCCLRRFETTEKITYYKHEV